IRLLEIQAAGRNKGRAHPRLRALCKWLRCANDASRPAGTSSGALLLQQRRKESVLEDIQRLIQIRAGVFGCDTRAKTDPILRYSRVVHGRDPKTTAPQFVPEA